MNELNNLKNVSKMLYLIVPQKPKTKAAKGASVQSRPNNYDETGRRVRDKMQLD